MAGELSSVSGIIYDNLFSGTPNPGLILGRILALYGSTMRGLNKVVGISVAEEVVTIAAAASSDSVANLLPANSLIAVVVGRVTVVIPTATSFTVGDATQAARFATGVAVAAGTTFVGMLQWNPAVASDDLGPRQVSAAKIRLTMAGGTPAANTGRVALQVAALTFTPPTA